MKSIIQLKKEEEVSASREDRRNKIESYFLSLKKEREENAENEKISYYRKNTAKLSRRPRNNGTFDLSESEFQASRNNFTTPNLNTESRLTQPNLAAGESTANFEQSPGDSVIKNDETVGGILLQRLKSLHWPKVHFYKITYVIFFPYYFLFTVTMPKLKVFISVKEAYFGFIFCILFLIGLTTTYYFVVSAATTYWEISNGLSGLISAGVSVNYLIYCLDFASHNDKYFNISIQEMMIVTFSVMMSLSVGHDLLFSQTVHVTSQANLLIAGGILASNGLVFIIQSIFMPESIPHWLHVVFFGVVGSYVGFVIVARV